MPLILILLSSSCVCLVILLIVVSYKFIDLRAKIHFLAENNSLINQQNQSLQEANISYIKQIEQLDSQLKYAMTENANNKSMMNLVDDHLQKTLLNLGNDLSKQLIESHKMENQEMRQLSEKNLTKATEKFDTEFQRLISMVTCLSKDIEQSRSSVDVIKQSLLSPSGFGKLAEITLENILKSSGLKANLDFVMQYSMTTEINSKLRPDAVIFLPAGNIMVIDAKASKFLMDDQEMEKLTKTMNYHLKSLSSKEYAENIQSYRKTNLGNVITLMFLPTEQAVEKIREFDQNFIDKAWALNIFPVGPMGLMNMLSFAKFQISDQLRFENQKLILDEVRKLILSINSIADHSQKLGTNIQQLVSNYDKFAASFNRNFLSKANNLQTLGVDTGKKNSLQTLERYHLISSVPESSETQILSDDS
jgi:DNA recombination protein RmuC